MDEMDVDVEKHFDQLRLGVINISHSIAKQANDSADRFNYFMLAAIGAAIALADRDTGSAALSPSLWLLAAAILFWGASFISGALRVRLSGQMWQAEIQILQVDLEGIGRPAPEGAAVPLCASGDGAASAALGVLERCGVLLPDCHRVSLGGTPKWPGVTRWRARKKRRVTRWARDVTPGRCQLIIAATDRHHHVRHEAVDSGDATDHTW